MARLLLAITLFGALGNASAHAGVFDAFKSHDRLRREAMSRGLSYDQAHRAATYIQYSINDRGARGSMTSLGREALKNGATWIQAGRVR
jgi:hypothetical protein